MNKVAEKQIQKTIIQTKSGTEVGAPKTAFLLG